MRGRLRRRIGCFVGVFVGLLIIVAAGIGWLFTTLFGSNALSAVLIGLLVLGVLFVAGRVVRGVRGTVGPVGDLVDAATRIEAGELGTTVPEAGPREARALARAFNSMSARLAADTEERRRLLADVSHELRTPLTVIAGNVEAMLDGLYPADRAHLELLLAETRQLERLVEDLRTLSLADAGGLRLHREPVDLADLATDVVAGFSAAADAAGVSLAVDATDVPSIELDPRRIRQVAGNLVSNAVRHTPAGGSVAVRVRPDADATVLEVADTGTGMDPDAAARAFDRFWRAGGGAGAGLGLAIVRDLVRAHGGDVSLVSAPGVGTTVTCRFATRPDEVV